MIAFDPEQRDQLWKARKALYPTLYRFDPRKKPINFVDDVVVPAERISELIRYLEEFFAGQHVPVAIFGHIGNGNAHIIPLLDVNDQGDFQKMVQGYHEIHQTVLDRFGGSICGEHGDGRVRAEYVKTMFGQELYDLFVRVKQSFDPVGGAQPRHQDQRVVPSPTISTMCDCPNPARPARSVMRSARSTMCFNRKT